jgi:hypothetical protein
MRYLEHGRVADVSRLRAALDWAPRPTAQAFGDFVEARAGVRLITPERATAAEQRVLDVLGRGRAVVGAATVPSLPDRDGAARA